MATLRLTVLGGFEAGSASGTPLDIPIRKGEALLAYLALQPGKAVPRQKLVGLLWGDHEESHAYASLRQTLTVLRKALAAVEPPALRVDRRSVALDVAGLEVDALRFRRLIESGTPADLETAAALYRGDLLDGFEIHAPSFETWLDEERRQLREQICRALLTLLEHKREIGARKEAVAFAQRLLALDPLQERVHRALMVLYGELGEREAALQQYHRCRDLLENELGVAPETEPEALHQALLGDQPLPEAETAAGAARAPASNRDRPEAGPVAAAPTPPRAPDRGTRTLPHPWRRPAAAAFALLIAGAAALAWLRPWAPEVEPASVARMAYPLPDKPSIAVLPFVNVGGDPEEDYFADGITDDLITGLSKVGGLFVIARNSTVVYKDQAVPIRRVAEDLGVRYVLEGSVRRADGRIRINAQLIDATTGTHVWAERYDKPMTDIFAVQDQVTQRVVLALAGQLTVERLLREARQQTHSPEAYDALLRALEYMRTYTRENLAIALGYLEQALELDPDYPRVHAELGGLYWLIANDGWETSFGLSYDEAFTKAKQHLKKAMRVPSPRAHQFISKSHSNEGRYDEAIAEAKKMIALNSNGVLGYETLGRALNKAGRASEGVEAMKMAMRLDPRGDDQGWVSYRLGEALYLSGQFDEAAEAFARSAERNQNEWSYAFLAASHAQAGRQEQAKTALATFDRIMAGAGEEPYTVAKVEGWAFKFQRDRARVQEGFRKAGMPEGAASTLELDWAQDVSPAEVPGATTIDAATAKNLVDRGVTVVDVRGDNYWNDGHVPGAVHLSLYSDFTEAKLAEVVAKDQELVILAHGSAVNPRSARACARAVSWGFSKVYYFREGYPGWQAAGYPIKVVQNQ